MICLLHPQSLTNSHSEREPSLSKKTWSASLKVHGTGYKVLKSIVFLHSEVCYICDCLLSLSNDQGLKCCRHAVQSTSALHETTLMQSYGGWELTLN